MTQLVAKGQIYWVNLNPSLGSVIKRNRPALIISNDIQNMQKQDIIIAPITSLINRVYPFEVLIERNGTKGKVMLDQIRTIDYNRIGKYLGTLTTLEMQAVEKRIKLVLALS